MGHPYGRDFVYDELMVAGVGENGRAAAKAIVDANASIIRDNARKPGEGRAGKNATPDLMTCYLSELLPMVVRFACRSAETKIRDTVQRPELSRRRPSGWFRCRNCPAVLGLPVRGCSKR